MDPPLNPGSLALEPVPFTVLLTARFSRASAAHSECLTSDVALIIFKEKGASLYPVLKYSHRWTLFLDVRGHSRWW